MSADEGQAASRRFIKSGEVERLAAFAFEGCERVCDVWLKMLFLCTFEAVFKHI
jgi:hypothetical protein